MAEMLREINQTISTVQKKHAELLAISGHLATAEHAKLAYQFSARVTVAAAMSIGVRAARTAGHRPGTAFSTACSSQLSGALGKKENYFVAAAARP
uniref:Uncharacterized protein n=1 Tax=Marseillevirus LCMAC103 TaxID=2506604 RepID=A0A481YWL6_9VIRU|nr:MAG: hypothetical protein LCMAC103_02540 [Marseillevirus LCMAC103]